MKTVAGVYEATYRNYLAQFGGRYLAGLAHVLGFGRQRVPCFLNAGQKAIWIRNAWP